MQRLKVDRDIRPLSEIRTGIASFIKQVNDTKTPLVITQNGKGVAILLGVREYEALNERLELLEDIQTSISQLGRGEGIDVRTAKKTVIKRLAK
jgi:prevent-host-death family protein